MEQQQQCSVKPTTDVFGFTAFFYLNGRLVNQIISATMTLLTRRLADRFSISSKATIK